MSDINVLSVIVAAVAGFVTSIVWYMIFGAELNRQRGANAAATEQPPPWKMVVELVRTAVLVLVVAYFIAQQDIDDLAGALQLGIIIWIGFPAIILSGSVLWENVPVKLAAIHAGDWLVKLLIITLVLGLWL
ncbi:MAG: DUF1761 domain-containing protein [Chloroflexi bacterium]|nr:DUF1761 domain-containing protein [Chloroflexota bacterium]